LTWFGGLLLDFDGADERRVRNLHSLIMRVLCGNYLGGARLNRDKMNEHFNRDLWVSNCHSSGSCLASFLVLSILAILGMNIGEEL